MPIDVKLTFYHRDEEKPEEGRKILVCSPDYAKPEHKDMAAVMLYRLMDAQFFKITRDAEFWAYADGVHEQLTKRHSDD